MLAIMGFLDSVTSWFKREAAEVKDSVGDLENRLDADLSRKEREFAATPEEKMDMLSEKIEAEDDAFAAIQDKIDAKHGKALADEELIDQPDDEPADESDGEAANDGAAFDQAPDEPVGD